MGIKHQKKVTSKPEKNRNILPIEDWVEDIAKRKPRRHIIRDILPAKRGEYTAIAGREYL